MRDFFYYFNQELQWILVPEWPSKVINFCIFTFALDSEVQLILQRDKFYGIK